MAVVVFLAGDRIGDVAVARGAAYYGMVRRGEGVKIAAGLARTYYIGFESDPPAAMCLVPGSAEPGQTIEQCFPEGVPAGYDCVTLESFPVQVECFIGDDGDGDPCSPQPDANVRCLAPDCAVSSDGSIACPDDKPVCEDPAGCSAPGSCGADGEGCQTEPGCAAAPEVCEREADEQAAEDAREDQPQPAPAQ